MDQDQVMREAFAKKVNFDMKKLMDFAQKKNWAPKYFGVLCSLFLETLEKSEAEESEEQKES